MESTSSTSSKNSSENIENKLEDIIFTNPNSMIIADRDGIIRSVNDATIDLFGYSKDELIGHNVSMLMPAPYNDIHDVYIREYHNKGKGTYIGKGRDVHGKTKNGQIITINLVLSEIRTHKTHIFIAVITNLSTPEEKVDIDSVRLKQMSQKVKSLYKDQEKRRMQQEKREAFVKKWGWLCCCFL